MPRTAPPSTVRKHTSRQVTGPSKDRSASWIGRAAADLRAVCVAAPPHICSLPQQPAAARSHRVDGLLGLCSGRGREWLRGVPRRLSDCPEDELSGGMPGADGVADMIQP